MIVYDGYRQVCGKRYVYIMWKIQDHTEKTGGKEFSVEN